MAFDDFLVHTCNIFIPGGEATGNEDKWGNPILTGNEKFDNVPCRFVKEATNIIASDGKSRIYETYILLKTSQKVSEDMTVSEVKDKAGVILHGGKLAVSQILTRNSFDDLHNYKVVLKGSG